MNYNESDMLLSDDFDLLIDKRVNNFREASWQDNTLVEQVLLQRIQSNIDDFQLTRIIAASLNDDLGTKLDAFLLENIRAKIIEALTIDGVFERENVEVNLVVKDFSNLIISIIIKKTRLVTEINNVVYIFSYNMDSNLTVNNF